MKNEKWKMKNEKWKMKNEKWKMKKCKNDKTNTLNEKRKQAHTGICKPNKANVKAADIVLHSQMK